MGKSKKTSKRQQGKLSVKGDCIHYWVALGIKQSDKESLTPQQRQALLTCMQNPNQVRFEKLSGYKDVYSIRYSDKGRLLLTIDNNRLVLLSVLENHEYEKELRKLKSLLSHYNLNKENESYVFEALNKAPFEIEKSVPAPTFKKVSFETSYEGQPKLLVLDDGQTKALDTSFPALIRGMPGSGKTTIAIALLNLASSLKPGEKLLYTTESQRLVDLVRREFDVLANEDLKHKVVVESYQSITNLEDSLDNRQAYQQFRKWVVDLKDTEHQNLVKKHGANKIYQELRLMCGYSTEDYCNPNNVGRKQRLLQDEDNRQLIVDLYKQWMTHLTDKDLCIPAFAPVADDLQRYQIVLVDEAQDLSTHQISSLLTMLDSPNVAFFDGDGQSLQDDSSKTIYIERKLEALGRDSNTLSKITLPHSYRCPASVMKLATQVNDLRKSITPKGKQEVAISTDHSANIETGTVLWHNSNKDSVKNIQQQLANNPRACIVTHPDLVAKLVQQGIPNYQVFTPETIKGLQYSDVIIYEPFHDEAFSEINRQVSNIKQGKHVTHGAEHSSPLSQMFVTLTRAQSSVEIYSANRYKALTAYLIEAIASPKPKDELKPKAHAPTSKEWKERAYDLYRNGNQVEAVSLLMKELNMNKSQVHDWKLEHRFVTPGPLQVSTQNQVTDNKPPVLFSKSKKVPNKSSSAVKVNHRKAVPSSKPSSMAPEKTLAPDDNHTETNSEIVRDLKDSLKNLNKCPAGSSSSHYYFGCIMMDLETDRLETKAIRALLPSILATVITFPSSLDGTLMERFIDLLKQKASFDELIAPILPEFRNEHMKDYPQFQTEQVTLAMYLRDDTPFLEVLYNCFVRKWVDLRQSPTFSTISANEMLFVSAMVRHGNFAPLNCTLNKKPESLAPFREFLISQNSNLFTFGVTLSHLGHDKLLNYLLNDWYDLVDFDKDINSDFSNLAKYFIELAEKKQKYDLLTSLLNRVEFNLSDELEVQISKLLKIFHPYPNTDEDQFVNNLKTSLAQQNLRDHMDARSIVFEFVQAAKTKGFVNNKELVEKHKHQLSDLDFSHFPGAKNIIYKLFKQGGPLCKSIPADILPESLSSLVIDKLGEELSSNPYFAQVRSVFNFATGRTPLPGTSSKLSPKGRPR